MPISEEEWKSGREAVSWAKRIFEHLDSNYPNAYSSADIVEELFEFEESEIQSAILVSLIVCNLEILMDRDVVEAKLVDNDGHENIAYYRRAEEVNDLDWQRQ